MSRSISDLGGYLLPGRIKSPLEAFPQADAGEAIGLGSLWVSERWENKEIASTLGALSQRTSKAKLVAGMTHFGTRHPIVIAGMGSTLAALSGNRFVMGFGRSVPFVWKKLGLPVPVMAAMADYANILRALWRGETVNYEGPAGRYPAMHLDDVPAVPPPIILAAVGPKTLALAGSHFDGVVLHPFLTTEGARRSIEIVRQAAEAAGRDPMSVKVSATLVVAPDASEEEVDRVVRIRSLTYFNARELGSAVIKMNGWDPAPMETLLTDPRFVNDGTRKESADELQARLKAAIQVLPEFWMREGAGIGSAEEVARRAAAYKDIGADEILLHGTTPDGLGKVAAAYGRL